MNTLQRTAFVLATVAVLAACGATDDSPRPEPPPVEDTVFGDTVGAMDKARAVEDTTMQHKQSLDAAIDASEGDAR